MPIVPVAATTPNADGGTIANDERLPHVAVLLLTWNTWAITLECLESLFRLDYPRFTVIVCDNGSTDGSLARFRDWAGGRSHPPLDVHPRLRHLSEPPVRKPIEIVEYTRQQVETTAVAAPQAPLVLIHNGDNIGYASGNNVGMRYVAARGDMPVLWVLNSDTVVAPDALRELVRPLVESPGVTGVGATLLEYSDPDRVQAIAGGAFSWWHVLPGLVGAKHLDGARRMPRVDFISGACLLAPTADVVAVGMFDEAYYMYGEDVDLSLKLECRGRLAYAAAARVWHRGGGGQGYGNSKHDYYTVRNSLLLVRTYYPHMMPAAVTYLLYRFVMPKIVRRQWDRLSAVGRAWRDFRRSVFGQASV
jgi:GT2 family glycosyltransferase